MAGGGKRGRRKAAGGAELPAASVQRRAPEAPVVVVEDFDALTKEQLKAECRRRGRKTTGTKAELLQRLVRKMTTKRQQQKPADPSEAPSANGTVPSEGPSAPKPRPDRGAEREERLGIVLHKRPLLTVEYFAREVAHLSAEYGRKLSEFRKSVAVVLVTILSVFVSLRFGGPQKEVMEGLYKEAVWCLYWLGLGILSSVGLGTGLHTFLLYLGPHIAKVTIAAYECGSLNFPEPPYPDDVVCPIDGSTSEISLWSIMAKVRLESMCWGAGTALGELPPYFMARAARLSGLDPDDEGAEDLAEFEQLQRKRKSELTLVERGKLLVEDVVRRVGFVGILACASIPNPLFDLAGITCGHFLVPFWTFFGATLLGKAVVKMHAQQLFVIVAFNESLIASALERLARVPVVGEMLRAPFGAFLADQKARLHRSEVRGGSEAGSERASLLGSVFEKFVFAMVVYFVVSIVNSLAQSYHKRLSKGRKQN